MDGEVVVDEEESVVECLGVKAVLRERRRLVKGDGDSIMGETGLEGGEADVSGRMVSSRASKRLMRRWTAVMDSARETGQWEALMRLPGIVGEW